MKSKRTPKRTRATLRNRFGNFNIFDTIQQTHTVTNITRELPEFTWIYKKHIGKGQFGNVEVFENEFGEKIAIKEIILPNEKISKLFKREINILIELSSHGDCCPNVLCYYANGHLKRNPTVQFVVTDYIEGKDLEYCIKNKVIDPSYFPAVFLGILNGLIFIHKLNIVHRDLKPANIMIEKNTLRPVIVDFGMSCVVMACTGMAGTPNYLAPEIYFKKKYTLSSDIFSLAVVFNYMLTGGKSLYPPNYAYEMMNGGTVDVDEMYAIMYQKIDRLVCPLYIKNIMKAMIQPVTEKRPTAKQIAHYINKNLTNHEMDELIA
jgi:serine/threonine protein kinase